jgi:signal transduction histidine kinase
MLASGLWVLPAILATADAALQWRLHGDQPVSWRRLLFAGGDWLVYGLLTPAIFWAAGRWPLRRPRLLGRAALHLALALLFCLCWALAGKLLETLLTLWLAPGELAAVFAAGSWEAIARDLLSWILTTLPFGVVVYLGIAGLAHAFALFLESRDRELQLARVSAQLTNARFAALQAQVNPHFLFNTLNTVVVRARDGDTEGTAHIVELLSDLLRRTLGSHRAGEVTLGEELDLVRGYLEIEQARFPDRLRAVLAVPDDLRRAAVPGFAVQHLVENAVRHGVAPRTAASTVRLEARREDGTLVMVVSDPGPGVPEPFDWPPGHGLDQTRQRLQLLYGERAALAVENATGGGARAVLRLPYRDLGETSA